MSQRKNLTPVARESLTHVAREHFAGRWARARRSGERAVNLALSQLVDVIVPDATYDFIREEL